MLALAATRRARTYNRSSSLGKWRSIATAIPEQPVIGDVVASEVAEAAENTKVNDAVST